MLEAVIFDFDGVIVDSEPMHFHAFQAVLNPIGISFTWEAYCHTYIGFDDRDAFKTALEENGGTGDQARILSLIEQKAAVFQQFIRDGQATPFPGVVELIKDLSNRLPTALCSGALREDIDPILSAIGIKQCFKAIVTAEDTAKSKPDPAPYQLTIQKLKLSNPANAIAIEDTPAGIQSAKGAGLNVLAVTNSYDKDALFCANMITDSLTNTTYEALQEICPASI